MWIKSNLDIHECHKLRSQLFLFFSYAISNADFRFEQLGIFNESRKTNHLKVLVENITYILLRKKMPLENKTYKKIQLFHDEGQREGYHRKKTTLKIKFYTRQSGYPLPSNLR